MRAGRTVWIHDHDQVVVRHRCTRETRGGYRDWSGWFGTETNPLRAVFLALAIFIFIRLRSVLGQRTGRERPPFDPYANREVARTPTTDGNVVTRFTG